MTEIQPRRNREVATYEGVESIRTAAEHRERMAAAVELTKRAGLDAHDALWAARDAERDLGRMIIEARAAGDLATADGTNQHTEGVATYDTLGISRDMAAHAVSLAKLPDDVWARWGASDRDPTRAAVKRTVDNYKRQLDEVKAEGSRRRQTERQLRAERERVDRELRELAERQTTTPDVPPLSEDETSLESLDIVAPATAAPEPEDRDRARGDAWLRHLRDIERIITELERHPPELPHDQFADMTVLSARDLGRRITNATAEWVRNVNSQYQERINQ